MSVDTAHNLVPRHICANSHTSRTDVDLTATCICLAMALLLTVGCSHESPDEQPSPPSPPPPSVRVDKVAQQMISPRLVAVGTVRPKHFSIIASAADGVVDEFLPLTQDGNEVQLEEGSFVTKGTVLSQLRMFSTDLALDEQRAVLAERTAQHQQILEPRKEDVEEAQAQHLAAEAAFANAERRWKELQSLATRGATNPSAVEDAELLYNEIRHRQVAAKAVFQRVSSGARAEEKQQVKARLAAQENHVAWLEAEKEKRITRAPFDGFLVQEQTYVGQWLSKGDPVATMAQLDDVDVEVLVDQDFVAQVRIGDPVHLKIAGTADPDSADGRWTGTVNSVIPRSDWESGSRSFPVIVRIQNRMNGTTDAPLPTLREGMIAEAEFFGPPFSATLVPKDSLVQTSRGTFVFAINPAVAGAPLSVRQVVVETGISKDDRIQVLGSDLEPGVLVVTEGGDRLRAFQSVQIKVPDDPQEPSVE